LIKVYDNKIPIILVGDPIRLHQIILNLVSNAVKFTNTGRIVVTVKLLEENKDNVKIEFAISDTGIGIPLKKTKTIFENFQQASSGTSRLYGGTGLGLAIVKQLVESQEGSIHVESKIGKGSTFSFTLRFLKTNAEIEPAAEMMEFNADIKHHIKVLVVEDISLNQLLMKTLLDDFGFGSDLAANGKIAIEKVQRNDYDIILMDLQMPEMNGFEATEYIRKIIKSNIPIIALTADVTTIDVEKCMAVGMNDYVAKPVDEKLLYRKIVGLVKYNSVKLLKSKTQKSESANKRCLNLDYLNKLTKSNSKLKMELINVYLQEIPELIQMMKKSLKDKDWQRLSASAHKIIPSFKIMGISSEFELMTKQIQSTNNSEMKLSELNILVANIDTICSQAYTELREELKILKRDLNGK
jgi:CheY-like chemotaxis protein/anti-sigma regulatory factor (Ser/Thr protein kinase)